MYINTLYTIQSESHVHVHSTVDRHSTSPSELILYSGKGTVSKILASKFLSAHCLYDEFATHQHKFVKNRRNHRFQQFFLQIGEHEQDVNLMFTSGALLT